MIPAVRPIEEVRAISDGIQAHIRELIAVRLDAIRSDRTAHQLHLARLMPMLADEFAGVKPAEEVGACADLSDRHPQLPTRELAEQADVVMTMGCGDACPPTAPAKRFVDWDYPTRRDARRRRSAPRGTR